MTREVELALPREVVDLTRLASNTFNQDGLTSFVVHFVSVTMKNVLFDALVGFMFISIFAKNGDN